LLRILGTNLACCSTVEMEHEPIVLLTVPREPKTVFRKRKDIRGFERILSKMLVKNSKRLIVLSEEFIGKCNLSSLDALHLAATCVGEADFILTCDDKILEQAELIEETASQRGYKLKVRNPVNYSKQRRSERKRLPPK
jgi:hypothetical protein